MCGRRFGKSLIAQVISVTSSINKEHVAYVTPTFALSKVFFNDILKMLPESLVTINKSDLTIDFITGGSINFFSGENLNAFRGRKFHRVIIDEAAYIKDFKSGWLNSIRPTLTDYKGKALFISTPRGYDYFYELFNKSDGDKWTGFKFTTYHNPYILKSEIDEAKLMLPDVVFEQEYMANPAKNAANPFGNDYIRGNIKEISTLEPIIYGIDLAKSYDYTVIIGLDKNGDVCRYLRFQEDWNVCKSIIEKEVENCHCLIDSTGVGDAIVEDLMTKCKNITGFKFTSESKQKIMEALAVSIQRGKIGYPDNEIVTELELFEYKLTANGVKYSAINGFHDDAVCALALANYGYVQQSFNNLVII
jgi:hypothetical protein